MSKFKLYLDEHLRTEVLPNNLDLVDVIADYLRLFHTHICNELSKGFAGNYNQSKFRYVKYYNHTSIYNNVIYSV
jgi:hypothetical protein